MCGQAAEAAEHWACCPQETWAILQGTTVEKRPQQGPATGQALFPEP